jgi:hypothetical protein
VSPYRFTHWLHGLPWSVILAVTIWLLSVGLRTLSLQQILMLVPGSWLMGFHSQAYYPGWSLVPYVQVVLAMFLIVGHAWARYATTLLVIALLSLHFSPTYAPTYVGTSFFQVRDLSIIGIYTMTVLLLWLPVSSRWFQRLRLHGAA